MILKICFLRLRTDIFSSFYPGVTSQFVQESPPMDLDSDTFGNAYKPPFVHKVNLLALIEYTNYVHV